MKFPKRITAIVLCLAFFMSFAIISSAEADTEYTITNPYEDVDFSSVNQYKADLHSHTTATDAYMTMKENIERHYMYGYDILAISDHGTTDYGWTTPNYIGSIRLVYFLLKGYDIEGIDESGTAANGNSYTYVETDDGDYYTQTTSDGETLQSMLRVPYAIENNPTSLNNAHVNSWFVDYGNGLLGGTSDYVTPIMNVDELGGLSVINHPGEYTEARDEVYTSSAYNKLNPWYWYVISKYEDLLLSYDSLLGIDINSKGDYRTRFDRKLWDILLEDLTPYGRNVYALATSDAHNLYIVNSGYTIMLMEENTVDELYDAMSSGHFFAASRYIGNVDELEIYAAALALSGNSDAKSLADDMLETIELIYEQIDEEGEQNDVFVFDEDESNAVITDIVVDDTLDTITISATGALYIRWISNGETVAEGNTISLTDCEGIGTYVRAEIISMGGIIYTQAFILEYDDADEGVDLSNFIDFSGIVTVIVDTLLKIISLFDNVFDAIYSLIA